MMAKHGYSLFLVVGVVVAVAAVVLLPARTDSSAVDTVECVSEGDVLSEGERRTLRRILTETEEDRTRVVSSWVALMDYDPKTEQVWIDCNQVRLDDTTIRALCASGRVCEVMGHQWLYSAAGVFWVEGPIEGVAGTNIFLRKCVVCGRQEKRARIPEMWSNWQEQDK